MENTSFIPKQNKASTSFSVSAIAPERSSGNTDIFSYIPIVVFLTSLILSGGIFLYQGYLKNTIKNSAIVLEREKANFEPALMQELFDLDMKLNLSGEILDKHISPLPIFDLVEKLTLKNTQFDSFSYKVDASGKVFVEMSGVTGSYNDVALQSNILAKDSYISDIIFSDLSVEEDNRVSFRVNFSVDSRILKFN